MATIAKITTADELSKHASELGRCELVRGELIMMSPAKTAHGIVSSTVNAVLYNFVHKRRLGHVFGGEAGFLIECNPDTVRAPDVGFVAKNRFKPEALGSFFPGAPDLALEVLSPGERAKEVRAKVAMWLAAGCQLVCVIAPRKRTVVVHAPTGPANTLTANDELTGGNVIPGFRIRTAEVFADLDPLR